MSESDDMNKKPAGESAPGKADDEEEEDNDNVKLAAAASSRGAKKVAPAAAGRPKSKAPRVRKAKDKPKRPLSGYNLFFKDERVKLIEERAAAANVAGANPTGATPKIGFEAMAKVIGARWREQPEDVVQKYQKLADEDMKRYKTEMDKYHVDEAKKRKERSMQEEPPPVPAQAATSASIGNPTSLEGMGPQQYGQQFGSSIGSSPNALAAGGVIDPSLLRAQLAALGPPTPQMQMYGVPALPQWQQQQQQPNPMAGFSPAGAYGAVLGVDQQQQSLLLQQLMQQQQAAGQSPVGAGFFDASILQQQQLQQQQNNALLQQHQMQQQFQQNLPFPQGANLPMNNVWSYNSGGGDNAGAMYPSGASGGNDDDQPPAPPSSRPPEPPN